MSDFEAERLSSYYEFDDEVLASVSEVAGTQRLSTVEDVLGSLPPTKKFSADSYRPYEVLDIKPNDYGRTLIYHLPMGNAIDANMATMLATLSEAEPECRVIGVSNPGSPGHDSGKIKAKDALKVSGGDLRSTAEPLLLYANNEEIDDSIHIGYSYGADKAAAVTQIAHKYDHLIERTILIEPTAVRARSLLRLAREFLNTADSLEDYVEAADSDPYREARKLAEKEGHGLMGYGVGLLRMSNLAIASALSKDGFESRIDQGLMHQPEMKANLIWGSESEIAAAGCMRVIAERLSVKHGEHRVKANELEGQKHALANDIFLNAALVSQSLRD